jgi:hypothetical protein
LRIAHDAALIPISRQTLLAVQEKPRHNSAGKTSE